MGSLMLCVFLIRQEDFGISGIKKCFYKKMVFCFVP